MVNLDLLNKVQPTETFIKQSYLHIGMRQFKATQSSPQYGPQSLYMRFIGKIIFMKGMQESTAYVDKLIADFNKKGASIVKGNGGWVRIDIIKDNETVKLGDVEFEQAETPEDEIENILYGFFFKKYVEAKFLVQEVVE